MHVEEADLQSRLRSDDRDAFTYVYDTYREPFLAFAQRFDMDHASLLDVYQESVIAMYQNFVTRQLSLDSSSVKTYLFGIGKNQIYTELRRQNKLPKAEVDSMPQIEVDSCTQEVTVEQRLLAKGLQELSGSCKELLRLFYYRGFTVREIVENTEYKDENTVKASKSRCMKGLRNHIQKMQEYGA